MWNLKFDGELNASIQIGDSVFSAGGIETTSGDEEDGGGFEITDTLNTTTNTYGSNIFFLGTIHSIQIDSGVTMGYTLVIENTVGAIPPSPNSYIFFSKNQSVNVSSLKGYYNAVKFKNDSKYKAELFMVSCDITVSSK